MGLPHLLLNGQKGGHHGVAIASRMPLDRVDVPDLCREGHARAIAGRINGLEVHNIYLPAGGDEPDPDKNAKFAHKLDFLEKLGPGYKGLKKSARRILVGDLNVAPHEQDVWSHKQLLKIVSHTPAETERLEDSPANLPASTTLPAWPCRTSRNSTPGGAIARRIGPRPIGAAGWTISGPTRPRWRTPISIPIAFIWAGAGAGNRQTTLRSACR